MELLGLDNFTMIVSSLSSVESSTILGMVMFAIVVPALNVNVPLESV